MPLAEAVQLLFVHQTLSKTILVQDALYAVPTANVSLKLVVNVKISSVHQTALETDLIALAKNVRHTQDQICQERNALKTHALKENTSH